MDGFALGMFLLAIGFSLMGYFIGKGLQNFSRPDKGHNYNHLIKESDLKFYLNLSQEEVEELLHKYPNPPKVELKGTTYYLYNQLMDWLSSNDLSTKYDYENEKVD
ncbi:DNA-binding protein [Bacillus sp. A301a_S52]|jgi:hypothetical protein|nr:DNA-binding protein [Bacillus sp. A301a_S52]